MTRGLAAELASSGIPRQRGQSGRRRHGLHEGAPRGGRRLDDSGREVLQETIPLGRLAEPGRRRRRRRLPLLRRRRLPHRRLPRRRWRPEHRLAETPRLRQLDQAPANDRAGRRARGASSRRTACSATCSGRRPGRPRPLALPGRSGSRRRASRARGCRLLRRGSAPAPSTADRRGAPGRSQPFATSRSRPKG